MPDAPATWWWLLALMILAALPAAAVAECRGKNLFAELEARDPATAAMLEERAAGIANGEGRLWRIEKPGIAPSHLFGTFHTAEAVETVPEAVWPVLDGARVAVFEIELAAAGQVRERMASDPGFIVDEAARPFAERMRAEDLTLVDQAFRSRGIAVETAERFQPWLQFSLLALPACQLRGHDPSRMLDAVLARRAIESGVPEVALEEPFHALGKIARLSEDVITRLIIASGRSAAVEEDLFATNLALYGQGRVAMVRVFSDWWGEREMPDLQLARANERMMAGVLVARNREWMPRILSETRKGNAFIAVGALHLTAETGLIAALRRAGFEVTRLD